MEECVHAWHSCSFVWYPLYYVERCFDPTAGPTSFVGRSADCTFQFECRPHGSDSGVQWFGSGASSYSVVRGDAVGRPRDRLTPMWREAVLAALVLHLSQGSQIPIGVKSHMLGLGTDVEDELEYVSPLPMMISPIPDSDAASPMFPAGYLEPPLPALFGSPTTPPVENALPTWDQFLPYTLLPEHVLYAPVVSPVTMDIPATPSFPSPGSPAAMDRILVGDVDLVISQVA